MKGEKGATNEWRATNGGIGTEGVEGESVSRLTAKILSPET